MRISMIVAMSTNRVIGRDGGLPWRLPEDLQRFKQITMGKPIIMGRATWESIGRPLPGRRNIVITRQADFTAAGCEVVMSPEQALQCAGDVDEVMIIGGGTLYRLFLPNADRLYLTRIHAELEGDTFFPELDAKDWQQVAIETYAAGPQRQYAFDILTLDRR